MKDVRRYLFGIVGASLLIAGTAHADRTMVVLLDASGSMTQVRMDGDTRYVAAQKQAALRVQNAAMEVEGLGGVAVLQFSGSSTVSLSGGTVASPTLVDPFTAVGIINGSSVSLDLTPLIGGFCDAIDAARQSNTGSTTVRLIEAYTDGEENNTPMSNPCFGDSSMSAFPYDLNSWQQKVYQRATNLAPPVTISTTLYTNVSFAMFFFGGGGGGTNPEEGLLGKFGRPILQSLLGFVSDEEFFFDLSAGTGGVFTAITDGQPLPVFADVDGDFDVDRNDAIALARQFGAHASEQYDLDRNGSIGWSDYALLIFYLGTGPGVADPYTHADTITCGNNDDIVIDGRVIEDGGITINAKNKCTITIRNSLIVSGASSIRFQGSVRLTIDDSIIVGESAWISGNGNAKLSAANTVFHGAQQANNVHYTDRGGNVFE